MICRHCGMSIPDTAETCPYCGKPTKRSFLSWNPLRLIAIAGPVLLLFSIDTNLLFSDPAVFVNRYGFPTVFLIVACIAAVVSMLVPKIELLYPLCALVIIWTFVDRLRFSSAFFHAVDAMQNLTGWKALMAFLETFSSSYSPLFLAGLAIVTVSAIVILLSTVASVLTKS